MVTTTTEEDLTTHQTPTLSTFGAPTAAPTAALWPDTLSTDDTPSTCSSTAACLSVIARRSVSSKSASPAMEEKYVFCDGFEPCPAPASPVPAGPAAALPPAAAAGPRPPTTAKARRMLRPAPRARTRPTLARARAPAPADARLAPRARTPRCSPSRRARAPASTPHPPGRLLAPPAPAALTSSRSRSIGCVQELDLARLENALESEAKGAMGCSHAGRVRRAPIDVPNCRTRSCMPRTMVLESDSSRGISGGGGGRWDPWSDAVLGLHQPEVSPASVDQAKERFPRIAAEKRGPRQKRDLDEEDPDPYIHWTDLKMGRTHTSRPGNFSSEATGSDDDVTILEAEVGREYLDKLTSQGKKNKAPAPEVGSSQGPPAKRSRTEVVGGKEVGKKRYQRKQMPVASGPALKLSKSASDHRAEEDHLSPLGTQDTDASNIGTDSEAAGRAEPQVPPVLKRKKKKTADSSPSKSVPDSSAPASSTPGQDAPDARLPPKTSPASPPEAPIVEPTGAMPTPPPNQGPTVAEPTPSPSQGPAAAKPTPPPEGTKPLKPETFKGKATASGTPKSGSQQLVLHAGRAAVVAEEAASAIPEASIEALKAQLSTLQGEKEQLIREIVMLWMPRSSFPGG
nr:uncharacterized protein LOC127347507 [Lolium perenne]